jgi:hypothetical protein
MDDPLARVALVVLVGLLAVGVGLLLSRRPRPPRPQVEGISPGVVVFASRGCDTCAAAETAVRAAVGDDYRVIVWEDDPEIFERSGIRAVPLVAVIGEDGVAWWGEGSPGPARLRRAVHRVTVGR